METQTDSLSKSIEQYETQLTQIRHAINLASSTSEKQDLYVLEKDIVELISLTKETLSSLRQQSPTQDSISNTDPADELSEEYALFKAELAELEGSSAGGNNNEDDESIEEYAVNNIPEELQEEIHALKGSKCQAPHKKHWGDESYYNALIMDIETKERVTDMNHIQVRVMFVNPTEREMLPCPYYLDGECKFTDDKCHFSHGELVPLEKIREYREPDFKSVKEGSQVLAKQKDNLWYRAKVDTILSDTRCLVKFQTEGCEIVELDLHDLLPLDNENNSEDDSSSSESDDDDDEISQEYFVTLSLLQTPPSTALGAWEKHTKGIGSRLMANMGYIVGCGLGKNGEGRLEPVEAMAYPPGKSLDACMALREAAGGDENMFKAEQRQKKQQRQLLRMQQKQQLKDANKKDIFSFINSKLLGTGSAATVSTTPQTTLASSSSKGLNVERFRLGESIMKTQKDIDKYTESLKRHETGSITHNAINNKLKEAQIEMNRLQNSDKLIAREQSQRDGRKKMSIF
uniref:Zinc finger CCCH-type with G patch domain-containing protein n=1 Tax=Homalodisca liturata TaxID=320908 RepID=A0A1B6JZP6_9HEMI